MKTTSQALLGVVLGGTTSNISKTIAASGTYLRLATRSASGNVLVEKPLGSGNWIALSYGSAVLFDESFTSLKFKLSSTLAGAVTAATLAGRIGPVVRFDVETGSMSKAITI